MVRLLVEEARDALPLPNHPQCERDVRLVISTSPHAPIPRSGFVQRPISDCCQAKMLLIMLRIKAVFAPRHKHGEISASLVWVSEHHAGIEILS